MSNDPSMKIASIIADSGGQIVGRTRLQKVAYLLTVAGFETGFSFSYKHYGPFSEELASAARFGSLFGVFSEMEHATSWGGTYSVYTLSKQTPPCEARSELAVLAARADAVELELAATAVFLALDGFKDPWSETERRKPEKASNNRLLGAKALLDQLSRISTPKKFPNIV